MRLGRPRPLPQPLPGWTLRGATGCGSPAPGASGRGSQPGAPGGSRAAPSPAPARRSRGRSSRRRPIGRSTGCTARSWWGRSAGAGTVRGAAAGGAGARDRPGWAPAARASRRRDYLIVLSGEEQGGGAGRPHPPAGPRRGGGHCSSLRPPPAPRPSPPALQHPSSASPDSRLLGRAGMRSGGPAKADVMGWGAQRDGVGPPGAGEGGGVLPPPLALPLTDPEGAETLN